MKRKFFKKVLAAIMAAAVMAGSTVPALAEQAQSENVTIATPTLEVVREDGKISGINFINNADTENYMIYDFCTEEEIEQLKSDVTGLTGGVYMNPEEQYEMSLYELWDAKDIGENEYLVTYCEDDDGNRSDLFVLEEICFSYTEKNVETSIEYGVGSITGHYYFPELSTEDYDWGTVNCILTEDESEGYETTLGLDTMGDVFYLYVEEGYTYEVLGVSTVKVSEADGTCLIEIENYTSVNEGDAYQEKTVAAPVLTLDGGDTANGIYVKNGDENEAWVEVYLVKEGEEFSTDNYMRGSLLEPGKKYYISLDELSYHLAEMEPGRYSIAAVALNDFYPSSEWIVLENFTIVIKEEIMESIEIGVGDYTGNYYFTDTNSDEYLYGEVVYEYTDEGMEDDSEESLESLYWKLDMLYLDADYLNSNCETWELKEVYLYKVEKTKEQIQLTEYYADQFDTGVYKEPIPESAKYELYRENGKVVGIKATNVMKEPVFVDLMMSNEEESEWLRSEEIMAGDSEVILFADLYMSGVEFGEYELKGMVYDWEYEFSGDWVNLDYTVKVENVDYTGGNVQVTKAYDKYYDMDLYNVDVAQFGDDENLMDIFYIEGDEEESKGIYKSTTEKTWQTHLETGAKLTGLTRYKVHADDQAVTFAVATIPEDKIVISDIEWKDAPGVVTAEFSDVHIDWYTEYVQYVFEQGMMNGLKGTDRFEPNANITKAQVAQVLYNLDYQPKVKDRSVFKELKDVYEGEWYADAVAWAYSNGVVTGDTNAMKFFPNDYVTREQLALMFKRYSDMKKYPMYGDGDLEGMKNAENVSNWALEGVKWAVGAGLISGIEKDGVKDLAPQGNATRAQVAAILYRFTRGE